MEHFWREEQARWAIRGEHRTLARTLEVAEETVSRWSHGAWPLPAYQAFRVARVQEDVHYVQRLATRNGYLLIARPSPALPRSPIVLLGDFAAVTSKVIETLIGKLQTGEKLTPEEAAEAEQLIDRGHADLEALREAVRRQTTGQ